jgi:hypothetical protein
LFAYDQGYQSLSSASLWESDLDWVTKNYHRTHGYLNVPDLIATYIDHKNILFIVDNHARFLGKKYLGGKPTNDRGWQNEVIRYLKLLEKKSVLLHKHFYFKDSGNSFDIFYKTDKP